jgi:uracil DNA glycosylase
MEIITDPLKTRGICTFIAKNWKEKKVLIELSNCLDLDPCAEYGLISNKILTIYKNKEQTHQFTFTVEDSPLTKKILKKIKKDTIREINDILWGINRK